MISANTVLTALLLAPAVFASPVASPRNDSRLQSRRVPGDKPVIIQLFEWTWDSVASECTSFIGPAGYGFVQVSPPAEHVTGEAWWTDYQPVSYKLESKRGNREQFASMVKTCQAAGVGVIVDTILNHMTGADSGTGTGGSSFTHYNYPGIYQEQDFNRDQCNGNIEDYSDRFQVQNCMLSNLADLKTGSDYTRGRLAEYIDDLLSLGVDGLRLDAAKHMPAEDIGNILSRTSRQVYITQEVIYGDNEAVQPEEYLDNGAVQEFRYTYALRDAFLGGDIASLADINNRDWINGADANVFVANHDTERIDGDLKYDSPANSYVLAHVFSLAYPYGAPSVLSSYSFSQQDAGSPNNGQASCSSGNYDSWLCQHRWTAIAGMVGFRNTVGSGDLNNWQSPQSSRIAFGRGSDGFVAINNSDGEWSGEFSTSLPDGTYCNVLSENCGSTVDVSGGSFSATISGRDAIAFHTGATA
ncbi:glycoside hydrolase family 13 protein [Pterulicium gracile]|uniref:Alpha-amylase n=1 Tax=Pterulicium gracile TaxID=1884261 RepID=A0A5C3QHL1_9AGAR|nr:glycoside hydrolase family 13 protein [Pterula gracilis]